MKTSTLRSQSGFSLVELMVVVAIIGVLAAMSAGQVQKQIAKARQSEAKTNLGTLWTSMEAFRAEYNVYTTDFIANKLAYSGSFYYNVGFAANGAPAPTAAQGYTGLSDPAAFHARAAVASICPDCVWRPGSAAVPPAGAIAPTAVAYSATAQGQPVNGTNDVWQITNTKSLTNTTDGIL
jgi:type IV pilus assembly protein PilA